ncbi:DUF4870 domain-containing protein [Streptomyces sirii]|uniref:DUF4870 domain-containing protein n=1 Tax=Streptomyces sirii TaxID=3127701 RepID=UPI003D36BFFC
MSDYHQPGYGPHSGGPQQPYGSPGWPNGAAPGGGYGYPSDPGHQQPDPGYQQPGPGYPQPGPGYQQPGPAYQQPVPGYGPTPGYGTQPPPSPSTSPAMWSHLGALLTVTAGSMVCCGLGAFVGWILPMSIRANERHKHDPYVRHHATQAVNFGITQAVMAALGTVLYFASAFIFAAAADETQRNSSGLAVPLLTVLGMMAAYSISGMVCAIIATVKATRGELWTYPRLIAWPVSKG